MGTDSTLTCSAYDNYGLEQVPAGSFTSVSSADDEACAVRTDEAVICWGFSYRGQWNPPPGSFTSVSTGPAHSCGLRTSRSVLCWNSSEAVEMPGTFSSVSAFFGSPDTCAVETSGSIQCWQWYDMHPVAPANEEPAGDDESAKIPDDDHAPAVPGLDAVRLSVGVGHVCRVGADESAVCWGRDGWGRLDAPSGGFVSVSAGPRHSCGIRTSKRLACWGSDLYGQASAPQGGFVSVAAGQSHSCGVRVEGSAVCWGDNRYRQADAPPGGFVSVTAGGSHSCGVRADGSAVCWGDNRYGQADAPQGSFTSISAGWHHSCGVRVGGSAVCWGSNGSGQADAPSGGFVSVSAGFSLTCGVRVGGAAACWGRNNRGQADAPSGGFVSVSAGWDTACGQRTGGDVACWGDDDLQPPAACAASNPDADCTDSDPPTNDPSTARPPRGPKHTVWWSACRATDGAVADKTRVTAHGVCHNGWGKANGGGTGKDGYRYLRGSSSTTPSGRNYAVWRFEDVPVNTSVSIGTHIPQPTTQWCWRFRCEEIPEAPPTGIGFYQVWAHCNSGSKPKLLAEKQLKQAVSRGHQTVAAALEVDMWDSSDCRLDADNNSDVKVSIYVVLTDAALQPGGVVIAADRTELSFEGTSELGKQLLRNKARDKLNAEFWRVLECRLKDTKLPKQLFNEVFESRGTSSEHEKSLKRRIGIFATLFIHGSPEHCVDADGRASSGLVGTGKVLDEAQSLFLSNLYRCLDNPQSQECNALNDLYDIVGLLTIMHKAAQLASSIGVNPGEEAIWEIMKTVFPRWAQIAIDLVRLGFSSYDLLDFGSLSINVVDAKNGEKTFPLDELKRLSKCLKGTSSSCPSRFPAS